MDVVPGVGDLLPDWSLYLLGPFVVVLLVAVRVWQVQATYYVDCLLSWASLAMSPAMPIFSTTVSSPATAMIRSAPASTDEHSWPVTLKNRRGC